MKVAIIVVGKTNENYLKTGILVYLSRLKHYLTILWQEISVVKGSGSFSIPDIKGKEGELILKRIHPKDFVVLLDERGKCLSSKELSLFMMSRLDKGSIRLLFVIGGSYGVSEDVKKRADFTLSLSKMTFSHQMVRLIFIEQLYRAMTILKGEKYHNQ